MPPPMASVAQAMTFGRIVDLNTDYPAVISPTVTEMTRERDINNVAHQSERASLVLH
jgi:hypothetical protein